MTESFGWTLRSGPFLQLLFPVAAALCANLLSRGVRDPSTVQPVTARASAVVGLDPSEENLANVTATL